MGQAEVLQYLRENPGWHSPATIAEGIGAGPGNIRFLLRKLVRTNDVEKKVENGKKARLYRIYISRM